MFIFKQSSSLCIDSSKINKYQRHELYSINRSIYLIIFLFSFSFQTKVSYFKHTIRACVINRWSFNFHRIYSLKKKNMFSFLIVFFYLHPLLLFFFWWFIYYSFLKRMRNFFKEIFFSLTQNIQNIYSL